MSATTKIDGIGYPTDALDILKSKAVGDLFRAYVKSVYADENTEYLDLGSRFDPSRHYARFYKAGGVKELNLKGGLLEDARALGEAGNWRDKAAWKKIHAEALRTCKYQLESNFVVDFYKSKPFRAMHEKAVRKLIRIPPAMKKQVGVDDDEVLIDMVFLFMSGRKDLGNKAAKALVKKKKMAMGPSDLVAILKKKFRF